MLCHFCLFFLSCVLGVFNSPVATPAYRLLGLHPSFRLRFISENASLHDLYVFSTIHGPTSLSFYPGPFHLALSLFYIFVPYLAFHVHVAGDLIKTISFVIGVLTTSFARALLRLIH